MRAKVDDKGRILIPQELRERFHLTPGQVVEVEATGEGVQILSVEQRLRAQARSVQEFTAAARQALHGAAPPMDPLELKRMWEPRL